MNLNVLCVFHTVLIMPYYTLVPKTLFPKNCSLNSIYIFWHVYYHPCFINKDQRSCVSCLGLHSYEEAEQGFKVRLTYLKTKWLIFSLMAYIQIIFVPVNSE